MHTSSAPFEHAIVPSPEASVAQASVAQASVAQASVAQATVAEATAAGASTAGASPALHGALLESRQRWRDLVTMASDLAFETDGWGRLVFVSPDPALGWPGSTLLGQPAEVLLAHTADAAFFNPFRPIAPYRRRRGWLRRGDGRLVCLSFAAVPLLDEDGRIIGARGVGQDISEQEGQDAAVAASLRRGEVLDHILWRMRQEVLAPRMMQAALEALVTAMGLEGAAVLDLCGDGVDPAVLHQSGSNLCTVQQAAFALLDEGGPDPRLATAPDGRLVLVCPAQTRFGERAGLALWRAPSGRAMDQDDLVLASSSTGIIRVILEHEAIQHEMARQARTDPLTSLLNRRAFLDEMGRRLERLDRDGLPGTLMFIDLDHFKTLNDRRGHDVGDEALCLTAALLRATTRPADLVARLGGDEFALWLDGADELAAAERAEGLRLEAPRTLGHLPDPTDPPMSMSIGIATRWPGRGEDVEQLINRADQVMYQVKRSGRGNWRVSRPEPG